MGSQDPLDKFREADRAYKRALAEAEKQKKRRDRALLAASATRTVRQLATEVKLSPGRVQQILERARPQR